MSIKRRFASVILFLAALILMAGCVTSPSAPLPKLTMTVPEQVENGNFVPFLITAARPLAAGDELVLTANGEVIYKVRASGKVQVYAFSGRLRLRRSGLLQVMVTARDGGKAAVSTKVAVARAATIPASGVTGNSNKTRVQGDELLVLFINDMPAKGFIESAVIKLTEGEIHIQGTPLLAEKPQLGFRTRNSLAKVEVSAVVKASP